MTNEERQQAIEWLKRRPVMMAGAKRMYDLAVEALEVYVPDKNVGKWIPVSERLPEEEGHYLVTDDSGGEKWVDSSVFLRSDDGSVYWDFVNVTAWMPLPEPWKGEG